MTKEQAKQFKDAMIPMTITTERGSVYKGIFVDQTTRNEVLPTGAGRKDTVYITLQVKKDELLHIPQDSIVDMKVDI